MKGTVIETRVKAALARAGPGRSQELPAVLPYGRDQSMWALLSCQAVGRLLAGLVPEQLGLELVGI